MKAFLTLFLLYLSFHIGLPDLVYLFAIYWCIP